MKKTINLLPIYLLMTILLACNACNECRNVDCVNGTCNEMTGQCECEPGFEGSACDKTIDPCEGVSCDNGSCEDGVCACEAGWEGATCSEPVTVPLFSWWNPTREDNFASSNPAWSIDPATVIWNGESIENDKTQEGYDLYRFEGHLFDPHEEQPEGTVPLFSWWSATRGDNFASSAPMWSMSISSINWNGESITNGPSQSGYDLYRLEGFVFDPKKPQPDGTIPLFSWWNAARGDNFISSAPYWSMNAAAVQWNGESVTNGPSKDGYTLYRLEGYAFSPK